jgi:signal transduction histidine kinase
MNYHRRSLHIYREFYMSHEGVTALIAVGNDYYTRGQYTPAEEAFREAADVSLKRHFFSGAEEALQGLAKIYIAMGRLREAYDAEQLRNDLYKKQLDTERSRQQSLYEARHELKKKEEMNTLLTANNELIRKEVAAQKRENWFYFTVIILMTVITFIILFGFLAKRKLSQKLRMQNRLIEEQKEELSSSLDFVKKTQGQLLFSEKMASLGVLTAGVAHELNNPLNFVSSGVGVLTELVKDVLQLLEHPQKPSKEEIKKLETNIDGILESVYDGVDRASKIIRDLNTFSSPREYEFTDIDISQPIEMSLTLLNKKIQDGHVNITRSYDHGSTCVRGNASQLSQVFMNIIDNAIHALEAKADDRQIIITTQTHPTSVEVIIEDNGPGIPPEIQTRIMEPFFTTKPVGKGSGLGLYISYDIIKNHWGRFTVSSTPGSLTSFRISLDILPDSHERKVPAALQNQE